MAATMGRHVIRTLVRSLRTNRFDPVEFVKEASAATSMVLDMIPLDAEVGIAGSTSVRQIGLMEELRRRGTTIIDFAEPGGFLLGERGRRTLGADILLASSNAVTLDGKLVNIDGIGNRVAGMIFGPRKVILVIGVNKIVRDVTAAIDRIKNVTAPYHAMTLGFQTPCATTGRCTDCKSPQRVCSVTTIIEKKPWYTDFAIVLVGEDLGLGWEPDWSEERKETIASLYREMARRYYVRRA